jgi:phospholipase/carboxylesterase
MTASDPVLDGPSLAPASGGAARQLVVLFHGYGADGSDLIPLGEAWSTVLPDAAFVAPNGPEPCADFPIGRQWFPLALRDPAEIAKGLAGVAPTVTAFLDGRLKSLGLGAENLVLAGFSQGAMLALDAGLRRRGPIAGIIAYSGLLVPPGGGGPFPPVLLGHGGLDPLVPAAAMVAAEAGLRSAGVRVEAQLRPALGHGIDSEEIAAGARFLRQCFAPPAPSNT